MYSSGFAFLDFYFVPTNEHWGGNLYWVFYFFLFVPSTSKVGRNFVFGCSSVFVFLFRPFEKIGRNLVFGCDLVISFV